MRVLPLLPAVMLVLVLLPPQVISSNAGRVRAVTDDGEQLMVPAGETYTLYGEHAYTASVIVNGTLSVDVYDGNPVSGKGTLKLVAPYIYIGPAGRIDAMAKGEAGGAAGVGYASDEGMAGSGPGKGQNGVSSSNGNAGAGGGGGAGYGGTAGAGGWGGDANDHGAQGGAGGAGGPAYGASGGLAIDIGSGGGGGGSGGTASEVGTAGGRGGGSIWLDADTLIVDGTVNATGGRGGTGGTSGRWFHGGGGGGGASGGGILVRAIILVVNGSVAADGGQGGDGGAGDQSGGACNAHGGAGGGGGGGGRIKLYYANRTGTGTVQAKGGGGGTGFNHDQCNVIPVGTDGSIYTNIRPPPPVLISPDENGTPSVRPTFTWTASTDPEAEPVTYDLHVDDNADFSSPVVNETDLTGTSIASPADLTSAPFFYWRVRAADPLGPGLWSAPRMLVTDRDPPASKVNPLPAFSNTTSFTVSWNGSDNASGVRWYSIFVSDNLKGFTEWLHNTTATSGTFDGADAHQYRFYSIATDRAMNVEPPHAAHDASIRVDATPPASKMNPLPLYQMNATFTVSWSATDAVSGVRDYTVYLSDNGSDFSPWQSRLNATSSPYTGRDGHTYTFYATARDRAGNEEEMPPAERFVTTMIDTSRPATDVAVGEPRYGTGPVFVRSGTAISLSANDTFTGVNRTQYSLDGGAWNAYLAPLAFTSPGPHNLSYRSTDRAGNQEVARTLFFWVDDAPPVTNASIEGRNWTGPRGLFVSAGTVVVISAGDDGSGVRATEYRIDGLRWIPYAAPFNLTGEGKHLLEYRSSDLIGNIGSAGSIEYIVDSLPPISSAKPPAGPRNSDVEINFTAEDGGSGVATTFYQFDMMEPGAWLNGSAAVAPAPADHSWDGTHTLYYYSVDNVGNAEKARKLTLTIDTLNNLTMNLKSRVTTSMERIAVTGVTDPGASVTVNGVPADISDGRFQLTVALKDGKNRIEVVSVDRAGNRVTAVVTATRVTAVEESLGPMWWLLIVAIVLGAAGAGGYYYMKRRARGTGPPPAPAQPPAVQPYQAYPPQDPYAQQPYGQPYGQPPAPPVYGAGQQYPPPPSPPQLPLPSAHAVPMPPPPPSPTVAATMQEEGGLPGEIAALNQRARHLEAQGADVEHVKDMLHLASSFAAAGFNDKARKYLTKSEVLLGEIEARRGG